MRAKFIGGINHNMFVDMHPDMHVVKIPEPPKLHDVWDVADINKPINSVITIHTYKLWKRMTRANGHSANDLLLYVPYSWTDDEVIAALVGF